jgi:hypothetical protein
MKKVLCVVILAMYVVVSGCETFRFAAREEQKENAYLHWQVAQMAAQKAVAEKTSEELQKLAGLSAQQSQVFVADYGMPEELPAADSAEQILNGSGAAIAATAYQQSMERPDMWQMADGAMELGIGLAGLLGGAYGIRATQFLKQAREKSAALKEIVAGNELFKQSNPTQASAFKDAQAGQSVETKTLVAEIKAGA